MRPIELTRRRSNGELQPIFVNPDRIEYFVGSSDGFESYVYFGAGDPLHVTEQPGQIIGRLADHRSAMHAEEHDGIEIFR